VRREALWILSNAVVGCNIDQLIYMFQYRIMDCFCDLLSNEDAKSVEIAVDSLSQILKKGNILAKTKGCENPFLAELEEKGGVQKIEDLQKHASHDVYEAALRLLEKNYELEDDFWFSAFNFDNKMDIWKGKKKMIKEFSR